MFQVCELCKAALSPVSSPVCFFIPASAFFPLALPTLAGFLSRGTAGPDLTLVALGRLRFSVAFVRTVVFIAHNQEDSSDRVTD